MPLHDLEGGAGFDDGVRSGVEPDKASDLEHDVSPGRRRVGAVRGPRRRALRARVWLLFTVFAVLAGSGLVFINNVAQIALARADEPAPGTSALDAAEAAAAARACSSQSSAFNFVGRLGGGPLTGRRPRDRRFCWRDVSIRLRTGC